MTEQQALSNLLRYKNDPWLFLTECVRTKDQVDAKQPVKAFPSDWPYLRLYCRIWQKYRLLAVPKSRRMTMSWTNIALYLHAALFTPGQDFAFVSKKEEDAGELVRRAEFIYDNIPEDKIPRRLLPTKKVRAQPQQLSFPDTDSKIQGFPMGADQLRQFTFSGILGDESAFWEEAQQFYSAAYPTIEGGGRMTLISSRSPGFFQRLVYDQLDHQDEIDETACTHLEQRPFKDDSVIFWINEKNKFAVFDVHYTANPKKAGPGFAEAVRNSMPIKDFLVEYERNWEAFEGRPVFDDYASARHESPLPIQPQLGLPLLLGWDFGLTPAAVVAQLRGRTLFILREYVAEHASIEKFAPEVMMDLKQRYPQWCDAKRDFIHYIDPAGLDEAQTDQRTCAGIMHEAGIRNIFPGPLNWEPRRKAVEHFLIETERGQACLKLYAKDCPTLQKGFKGGYRYPDKYAQLEPGKPRPLKNKFSHPHDGLQYLCGGAYLLLSKKPSVSIKTPEYAFTHEGQDTRPASRKEQGYDFGR